MTLKILLTVFLTSLSSIAALAPNAVAQERPECYIIDESGELTDLTDICDASQGQSRPTDSNGDAQNVNQNVNVVGSEAIEEVVLNDNVYVLRETSLLSESDAIDSAYYIDNEIGSDYAAYIRRYQSPETAFDRQTIRDKVFQFDTEPSLTSILRRGEARTPFLIYRYQK